MLYQVSLTIPANTPADRPAITTIEIEEPYLQKIGVHFPAGCVGMVKAVIFYGNLQLWPAKEGEWVSGDDITIWDTPYIRLPEKPTKLICKGCSPGTTYDHRITFYFIALPKEYVVWMKALGRLVGAFMRFFRIIGMR